MNKSFWDERYDTGKTGWDIGQVSPPLKAYIDQLERQDLRILIPGCGYGHEGRYLWTKGFHQTYLLDFSEIPKSSVLASHPNCFPERNWYIEDFFQHSGAYDLIIEQTLFCAIDPSKRADYAKHTASLLKPEGKLVGLLFNRSFEGGPPFGGSKEEYEAYFQPYFSNIKMDECYNSIEPRLGTELFIQLQK
jgi:SAM-dependent methyltransferase